LGFFLGGASGLAVDEEFATTWAATRDVEATIVVHAHDDVEPVAELLRQTRPTRLQIV
jgi:hypothetical protein